MFYFLVLLLIFAIAVEFECIFLLCKYLVFSWWHYPRLYIFPLGVLLSYFLRPEFVGVDLRLVMVNTNLRVLELYFVYYSNLCCSCWEYCCPIIPCFFLKSIRQFSVNLSMIFTRAFLFSWSFLFSSLRILTCSSSNSIYSETLDSFVDVVFLSLNMLSMSLIIILEINIVIAKYIKQLCCYVFTVIFCLCFFVIIYQNFKWNIAFIIIS